MSANAPLSANEPLLDEHEAFERCLREIMAGRVTVRECAQRYPDMPELGAMLDAALRAHNLPRPSMPAAARDQLRAEVLARHRLLYETSEKVPAEAPRAKSVWRKLPPLRLVLRPLFGVAIIVGLFFGGGVMLIQAARGTVPGEALYGLKLAVEYAELSFAEPAARPAMLDNIAHSRLDEVAVLRERGQVIPASAIFDAAEQVNAALLSAPSADEQRELYLATVQELQRAVDAGQLGYDSASEAVASLAVSPDVRMTATIGAPDIDLGRQPEAEPPVRPIATATATPTLEPTRTVRPSHTPRPTDEREPTRTVRPSSTPRPTDEPEPTRTVRPTRTPRPTDEPEPTRTVRPSSTPRPTDEPEPTRTVRPTRTPRSTRTPRNTGSSGNSGNSGNPGNGNSGNPGNPGKGNN